MITSYRISPGHNTISFDLGYISTIKRMSKDLVTLAVMTQE